MKFDFLDLFLAFMILPLFLTGLIILTFFLWTTFLIPICLLTSHQGREPRTIKDGINHGQPTRTSLRYGLRLPKTQSPPARTE